MPHRVLALLTLLGSLSMGCWPPLELGAGVGASMGAARVYDSGRTAHVTDDVRISTVREMAAMERSPHLVDALEGWPERRSVHLRADRRHDRRRWNTRRRGAVRGRRLVRGLVEPTRPRNAGVHPRRDVRWCVSPRRSALG